MKPILVFQTDFYLQRGCGQLHVRSGKDGRP